jgi:hypothetical protein
MSMKCGECLINHVEVVTLVTRNRTEQDKLAIASDRGIDYHVDKATDKE